MERVQLGEVPAKPHIAFRGPEGQLRWEECLTRDGFDGLYTILYHERRPHEQRLAPTTHGFPAPSSVGPRDLAKRHYKSQDLAAANGAPVDATVPLLFNKDLMIGVSKPDAEDPVYRINSDGDDLYWIFEGSGTLRTTLGDLRFKANDYVYVPKGLLHRFVPDVLRPQYWLHFETVGQLGPLKQFRNEAGQLRMDAPYSHRDFVKPTFTGPIDERLRNLVVKRGGRWHGFTMSHSPLDVIGWDGALYPWTFDILKFQARAGLVHLPPTWHGTFAARGALICSFVPRVVDFHPQAIPCPYPHHSVDVDEFLFYARGNFTSRRGVGQGSISHHPPGIPHGPHPGAYEASIGHRSTDELAVMLDCYAPLEPTSAALHVEDPTYHDSFIE